MEAVSPAGTLTLIDVYSEPDAARVLYQLLGEREPYQSISHKATPTWEAHIKFVASRPYLGWYLIQVDDGNGSHTAPPEIVGAIYLTKQREVGLFVFKVRQGRGHGKSALAELRRLHPGRLLANIAPGNEASTRFFGAQGFRHIQNTFELAP